MVAALVRLLEGKVSLRLSIGAIITLHIEDSCPPHLPLVLVLIVLALIKHARAMDEHWLLIL